MSTCSVADDMLDGSAAIARFIGETPRQTQHLLETGQLPAFKLGPGAQCKWRMRRSTYLKHIERLEAAFGTCTLEGL
jgi:hypothetical protein